MRVIGAVFCELDECVEDAVPSRDAAWVASLSSCSVQNTIPEKLLVYKYSSFSADKFPIDSGSSPANNEREKSKKR